MYRARNSISRTQLNESEMNIRHLIQRHKSNAGARRGFTLIELLVVIAIIALLVSILLPSLTKAKDLAKQVVCSTKIHSMGIGMAMYSADNNGSLPNTGGVPPSTYSLGQWESDPNNWVRLLVPYVPSEVDPSGYETLRNPSAWLCPSDVRMDFSDTANKPSYAVNIWLTGFYAAAYGQTTPYKMEEIPDTGMTPMFSERDGLPYGGHPESITWHPGYKPYPHRHLDNDLFGYVDLHVGTVPNMDVVNDGWGTRIGYQTASEYFTQNRTFWQ